jgi:uncharacterized protein YjbI with pentapeptide repeats
LTKHPILFLAANPLGTDRRALDREARAIQDELERSGHRDKFELVTRWATEPLDLLRALRKVRPTVVHFSGHGGDSVRRSGAGPGWDVVDGTGAVDDPRHGLFFQGLDGRPQLVSTAALEETFGATGSSVKLVVLNACYSEVQAEALLAHVGCVVGMTGSIRDDAARNFAIGFYGGIGERESVAAAYKQGCAAISLEGQPDNERPQLKIRDDIDADQLVLADHAVLVRDLLTRDLAAWGGRHVFGNMPRERWDDDEAVPFLPLEEIYVEPDGALLHDGQQQPSEPLLMLIERLTAGSTEPRVIVVTADFGSGKSLSARMLACRWAEQCLTSLEASLEVALPIHVRCADDFPSETVDLELMVRRAWKRQADSIGHSVTDDDDSFAWPSPEQRMVCLLDGLDEVLLGEQHLQTLLQKLRGKTTRNHRFVIFSRPGALPAQRDLGANVVLVHVQPFSPGQIAQWLARWNSLRADDPPITSEDLAERDLAAIVRTPILLFMVAFTWGQETTKTWPPSIAELYERFFYQVASGKAGADPDLHRPIAVASDRLLAALQTARLLDARAKRPDAMLWLMGRVAWEAHMLEQRRPPEPLTRWHVDSMLRDGEVPIPPDAVDAIRIGLVLTLQADLHGANHIILFGHQSFREFLVGRHWATTLRRLVRNRYGNDTGLASSLLGGRLLGERRLLGRHRSFLHEDRSFEYLMQLINAQEDPDSRFAALLGWNDDERKQLVRWAQETFADERQEFGERARPRRRADAALCHDQRAELREAALAIGSMARGSVGIRMNPSALRSMLAWFWLTGDTPRVIAPQAQMHGAILTQAVLVEANLSRAGLGEAHLRGADLSLADISGADLNRADLGRAMLSMANLEGANLSGADLRGANVDEASLRGAHLLSADLGSASLRGADLREAYFGGADLRGADFRGADLRKAYLGWADLRGADFRGADLRETYLGGADLRGADLRAVNLDGADLRDTDLNTTKFRGSDIAHEVYFAAKYSRTTKWPDGFDPDPLDTDDSMPFDDLDESTKQDESPRTWHHRVTAR